MDNTSDNQEEVKVEAKPAPFVPIAPIYPAAPAPAPIAAPELAPTTDTPAAPHVHASHPLTTDPAIPFEQWSIFVPNDEAVLKGGFKHWVRKHPNRMTETEWNTLYAYFKTIPVTQLQEEDLTNG